MGFLIQIEINESDDSLGLSLITKKKRVQIRRCRRNADESRINRASAGLDESVHSTNRCQRKGHVPSRSNQ